MTVVGKGEWIECREICGNCPLVTNDTPKNACVHPWRHEIADHVELSGDGTVTRDVPRLCEELGAVVAESLISGSRPSVQVYAEEPDLKDGFIKAQVQ